jgi:3-dehydroquinate synthase class II
MAIHEDKIVWVCTREKEVLTAALENGFSTLLVDEVNRPVSDEWSALGRFDAVVAHPDGRLVNASGAEVGRRVSLRGAADLAAAEALASRPGIVLMHNSAGDWHIIPAENLVAAFAGAPATLLAAAPDAAAARVMLEALEIGVDGVALHTHDPAEVRALAAYIEGRRRDAQGRLRYESARVVRVKTVGMGDRACVDLAVAMTPGEGLLVGSFARALFLVHSECADSGYIAARPFRVNAGPVSARRPGLLAVCLVGCAARCEHRATGVGA